MISRLNDDNNQLISNLKIKKSTFQNQKKTTYPLINTTIISLYILFKYI